MNLKNFVLSATIILLLSACQNMRSGNFDNAGNSSKNISNSGILQVAQQTLLGNNLITQIGNQLDMEDLKYYHQASQSALENGEDGKTKSWANPNNWHYGVITPTNILKENGIFCREYRQTININGKENYSYNTACRDEGGVWSIKQKE